jgi:hypothetical protein
VRATAPIVAAALLFLLGASPASAETRARLLVKGAAAPGADVQIQVELSWDGRPETLIPRVPTVVVPEGGAVRLGTTGSRFDGERSTWWTNGVVTLPDRGGPYAIGPATVSAVLPTGGTEEHVAPARTLGRGRTRSLLGQGVASGAVLALALGLLGAGWAKLVREEAAGSPIGARAAAVREALDRDDPAAALDAALALHDLLADHPVARDYLGPREGLEACRDELAFGGGTIGADTVKERVGPLLAIAGALE